MTPNLLQRPNGPEPLGGVRPGTVGALLAAAEEMERGAGERPDPRAPRTRARGPNPLTLTDPDGAKAKLLAAYRELGTVRAACAATGIGRRTWYGYVETDRAFAVAVADAAELIADELETAALARAKDGSDALLMFLLRTRRRAIYGEQREEIGVVSPDVRRRVAETVQAIARDPELTQAQRDRLLHALEPIWR